MLRSLPSPSTRIRVFAAILSAGTLLLVGVTPVSAQEPPAHSFRFPAPVQLNYEVEGKASSTYSATAILGWQHTDKAYTSKLVVNKFGIPLQTWTSQGALNSQGLEPTRFDSKRLGSDAIHADFLRDEKKIRFSAKTPDAPLEPGAQDQLSVFMQLASLLASDPKQGAKGQTIAFQAIGDRYAENWIFAASGQEAIRVPGGEYSALKITHEPTAERSQKLEIWYAVNLDYLPIRIRITEGNSDFLDMRWTDSQKP